ncbi:MAG: DUF2971 domain-containing protein [Planctomycetes bacterium]|nr:DUF2971 domain-containing protein [Planctomycetota bacterium]
MTRSQIDKLPIELKKMYQKFLLWLKKEFYEDIPLTLFHYTTQNGFLGIIDTKSLRMSDNKYLNDTTEYTYAVQLVKDELKKRKYNKLRNFLDINRFDKSFERIKEEHPIFVCSFSEKEDLLSQWRGYSPSGGGFSIGFDKSDIVRKKKKYREFNFVRCVYKNNDQRKFIRKFLDDSVCTFQKYDVSNEYLKSCFINNFFLMLLTIVPMLKHRSFREEREWRIVSNFRKIKSTKIKFREGKFVIVPYVEFKFANKHEKLKVSKIIVGPNPHMELSLKSVKSILVAQNVNCAHVEPSIIPYRGW